MQLGVQYDYYVYTMTINQNNWKSNYDQNSYFNNFQI